MWRSERFCDEQVEGQNKSQYNSLELGSAGKGSEPDKKAEAEVPPCQHLELMRSVSPVSRETAWCCHCCSSEPTSHYFKKLENSCSFPFGVFNKVSSVFFWEGFFAMVTKYPFSSPWNLNQDNLLNIPNLGFFSMAPCILSSSVVWGDMLWCILISKVSWRENCSSNFKSCDFIDKCLKTWFISTNGKTEHKRKSLFIPLLGIVCDLHLVIYLLWQLPHAFEFIEMTSLITWIPESLVVEDLIED